MKHQPLKKNVRFFGANATLVRAQETHSRPEQGIDREPLSDSVFNDVASDLPGVDQDTRVTAVDKVMRRPLAPEAEPSPILDHFGGAGYRLFRVGTARAAAAHRNALVAVRRNALRKVWANPSFMPILCRAYDAWLTTVARQRTCDIEMHAVLDGIVALKRDKVALTAWFKSGLSPEDFCRREDYEPYQFARMIDAAAEAMRIQPLAVDLRVNAPDLLVGVEAIAEQLGRTIRTTQRLIDAGKLPVGVLHGLVVSTEGVLRPFRAQKSRRGDDRPKWYRPQLIELYTKPWKAKHGKGRSVLPMTLERALAVIDAHLGLNVPDASGLYCTVNSLLAPAEMDVRKVDLLRAVVDEPHAKHLLERSPEPLDVPTEGIGDGEAELMTLADVWSRRFGLLPIAVGDFDFPRRATSRRTRPYSLTRRRWGTCDFPGHTSSIQ
jgi:hypothetical protein